MTQREEMLMEYLENQATAYKILIVQGLGFLSADDIWTILQSELGLEYHEVLHERLDVERILHVVVTHVSANGSFIGKIIQHPNEEDIIWNPVVSDELKKANVRNNGRVWVIHQNDLDPHPSVPHAHDYQNNLKLDLYNGNLYVKKTQVGKMKEKALTELVGKIKRNHPNISFKNKD